MHLYINLNKELQSDRKDCEKTSISAWNMNCAVVCFEWLSLSSPLIQSPDDSLGPSCVVLRCLLPQTVVQLVSWWEGLRNQQHLPSC